MAEREDLMRALEEIERMVGREKGAYRQTLPDIDWTTPGIEEAVLRDRPRHRFTVRFDLMGRLAVKRRDTSPHLPVVGDVLWIGISNRTFHVESTEKIYQGDQVVAVLCERDETAQ